MRKEYDFQKGERGSVGEQQQNKVRITIRLDSDVIRWFKNQVDQAGGGSYQRRINDALREHMAKVDEPLEETLRRILREELQLTD